MRRASGWRPVAGAPWWLTAADWCSEAALAMLDVPCGFAAAALLGWE